jgi:ATP synthase protein I
LIRIFIVGYCREIITRNKNLPNSDQRDQLEERLKSLDSRLSNSDRLQNSENKKSDNVNFSNAIRLSTEFVVAILVGVGIGWAIDYFLGTAPWGMIIMLPLGFIAGVRNIMRAAGLETNSSTEVSNEDSDKIDRK